MTEDGRQTTETSGHPPTPRLRRAGRKRKRQLSFVMNYSLYVIRYVIRNGEKREEFKLMFSFKSLDHEEIWFN